MTTIRLYVAVTRRAWTMARIPRYFKREPFLTHYVRKWRYYRELAYIDADGSIQFLPF